MFRARIDLRGNAVAGLKALYKTVQDRKGFATALGLRGRSVLKDWFLFLDRTKPNVKGWPRLHFWRDVADKVGQATTYVTQAVIPINHPIISHKAGLGPAGGIIRPINALWLTIPAVPDAYGKTAAEFTGRAVKRRRLIFIKKDDTHAFLGQVQLTPGKTGPRGGTVRNLRVIYILRKYVHQKADPDALPNDDTWRINLLDAGRRFLEMEAAQVTP